MQIGFVTIMIALCVLLVLVYLIIAVRIVKNQINIGAIVFVLMGMMVGLMVGAIVFYNLDKTIGWNPYGWWFPATFISTVIGGLLSVIILGKSTKEQ